MTYHRTSSPAASDSFPNRPCVHPDCKYRAQITTDIDGCGYLLITGTSRSAQHPPHKRSPHLCKLYEPGNRVAVPADIQPQRGKVGRKNKYDWSLARKMREEGQSNEAISYALGCSRKLVSNYFWSINKRKKEKENPND